VEFIKRMGLLYGKLGLSTDPSVISARHQGLIAACDEFSEENVANVVGTALGLKGYELSEEFMSFFSEQDAAFDVAPHDKEAALLASCAISYALEERFSVEDPLALCLVTASFGSTRPAIADSKLVELAEQKLAELQTDELEVPADRKYNVPGQGWAEAIAALEQPQAKSQVNAGISAAQQALQVLASYAESNAKAAARSDNDILCYLHRLESEVRVYWWVSSGWSGDTSKPFKQLGCTEAAIRAGKELADKSKSSSVGLFAAPALLSMVLERGRASISEQVTLANAATAAEQAWRRTNFQAISEGIHASLMPLSTAMGLAASSDDEDDWQPRFERLTGLKVTQELTIEQLAIQMYRERLVASLLK